MMLNHIKPYYHTILNQTTLKKNIYSIPFGIDFYSKLPPKPFSDPSYIQRMFKPAEVVPKNCLGFLGVLPHVKKAFAKIGGWPPTFHEILVG